MRQCAWCKTELPSSVHGGHKTCLDCPPDLRQPHGTKAAYNWHIRAGILPPCEPCRQADRHTSKKCYDPVKYRAKYERRIGRSVRVPESIMQTRLCEYCGESFTHTYAPSQIRKGTWKTCSRSCGQRLRTRTNPRSPDDHRSTRRVREQAAVGLSAMHRKQLLPIMAAAHYGGMCAYCGIRPANTFDHVIPLSRPGGTNEMHNLEPACKQCNSSKLHQTLLGWMTAGGWARMAA